jgi:hypothetical protein
MTDPVVPPAAPAPVPVAAAGPKQALSLTSFIMGLAGLLFCAVPFFGFLVALAAVIIGFIGRKREPAAPKWMSLVGIIAGFVAIVLGVILTITLVILPLLFVASACTSVGVSCTN